MRNAELDVPLVGAGVYSRRLSYIIQGRGGACSSRRCILHSAFCIYLPRRADGRGANKSLYRATSIPFLCTEQRNGRKKIGIRGFTPYVSLDSRPLPVRIACGRAAQFAGAGGILRQTNLCFRRLEVRTAKMEKLTRIGNKNFPVRLGGNSQRLKPRSARIWNEGLP